LISNYEFRRKAYRLLDLEDNSIIISRDVIFHEHKPGGEELTDTIFSQETIQTFTHPEPRSIPSKIPADDNTPENFDDHDPEANMEPDTEEREDYNSDEESGPPSPASFKSGPSTPFPMSDNDTSALAFHHDICLHLSPGDPSSILEAQICGEWEQWEKALQSEYDSLIKNGTWEVVDLPKGRKAIGSKWDSKRKRTNMGTSPSTKQDSSQRALHK
jgi:hypothetical protein